MRVGVVRMLIVCQAIDKGRKLESDFLKVFDWATKELQKRGFCLAKQVLTSSAGFF